MIREDPSTLSPENIRSAIVEFAESRELKITTQNAYKWGAKTLIDWLCTKPGDTWPERWLASESEIMGHETAAWLKTKRDWERVRLAITALMCLRIIQPSYRWINAQHFNKLHLAMSEGADKDDFDLLKKTAEDLKYVSRRTLEAMMCASIVCIHTGKRLPELTTEDLLEYDEAKKDGIHAQIHIKSLHLILRYRGWIKEQVINNASYRIGGKRSVDSLLDQYKIFDSDLRMAFGEFLRSKEATVSAVVLKQRSKQLLDTFWNDILKHNPTQSSLQIDWRTAHEWKQRLRNGGISAKKAHVRAVLTTVKSFYNFLEEMSHTDPDRWMAHASHNPITLSDITTESRKASISNTDKKSKILRLIQYTPAIRLHFAARLSQARRLIEAANAASGGEIFELDGQCYQRSKLSRYEKSGGIYGRKPLSVYKIDGNTRQRVDAIVYEGHAFWAWVILEILIGTGMRPWELYRMQIGDLSRQSDDDGKVVPCFRIPAAKTEIPRIVPMTPAVADVVAEVIRRVKGGLAVYPRVSRFEVIQGKYEYDLPLLLQKRYAGHHTGFDGLTISSWFKEAQREMHAIGGLPEGLYLDPKDCRRLFASMLYQEKVPLVSIARLMGHQHVTTTISYIATNPRDDIHYLHELGRLH